MRKSKTPSGRKPGRQGRGRESSARKGRSGDAPPLADLLADLREMQAQRRAGIKIKGQVEKAILQRLRYTLGWRRELPAEARTAIAAAALKGLASLARGRDIAVLSAAETAAFVEMLDVLRPLDKRAETVKREMAKLAPFLPGRAFQKSVAGFGDATVAVLAAETGDLSNYPPADAPHKRGYDCLWQRLGLGPRDGYPRSNGGVPLFPARRRAEVYAGLQQCLLKAQWRGETDAKGKRVTKEADRGKPGNIPAHAVGPYGEVYANRKAEMVARNEAGAYAARADRMADAIRRKGGTPSPDLRAGRLPLKLIDMDAQKYMVKRCLKHWWRSWRREARRAVSERTVEVMPPAAPLQDGAE